MVWNQLDVSEDTRKLLDELVSRKLKTDRYKRLRLIGSCCSLALFAVLIYRIYFWALVPSGKDMFKLLSLLTDRTNLWAISLFASSFLLMNHYAKQYKKQKDKYEALRIEAIEHLRRPWTVARLSGLKDVIADDMKKTYDINLVYKS